MLQDNTSFAVKHADRACYIWWRTVCVSHLQCGLRCFAMLATSLGINWRMLVFNVSMLSFQFSELHDCFWLKNLDVWLNGNNFPNSVNVWKSLLCSLCMLITALFLLTACRCLISFLLLPSVSSPLHFCLPALLCLVAAAAEGCTLSGLTRCPLRGSGLLAAAPGDTTHSPEPCSGTAGSPSHWLQASRVVVHYTWYYK